MPAKSLPSRPSLDHLKHQAADLRQAHRAGDPTALARLREFHPQFTQKSDLEIRSAKISVGDAQWVVAREYGFASWPKLKRHVESLPSSLSTEVASESKAPGNATERLENLARDLVSAFESDDAAALQRLNEFRGRASTREDVRADIWHAVYKVRQGKARPGSFAITDAQEFLARTAGHGNWEAFLKAGGVPPPGQPYTVDGVCIAPRRSLSDGEWDTIVAVMRERRLTTLEAGDQMTDRALGSVAQLGHVTRLHLGSSQHLTDDGLKHLAQMPQLEELDLSNYPGSRITDLGLEVLRHLLRLKQFKICWQPGITDAGVAHLRDCDELEVVNLLGTPTGDGALHALAGKHRLRRLNTGKLVTDAGLSLLHQFPVFKNWQGGELKYSLMSPEAGPNHLMLDGPFTDAGLSALAGLDGMFGLSFFWHVSAMTSSGLKAFGNLKNLGFLGCEGRLCNDEAMRHIATIPRLRMLMAQGTVATDDGFDALRKSATLEYLWGRECPNLTGRGLVALSKAPALRGLAVSCRQVDDAALSSLARFPALRELMPMDVKDDGFRHVGACEKLERLWCMYCRETTDAATEQITGLHQLRTYYAGLTQITDRSLELLGRMTSLEDIEFYECRGITDAGLPSLARLPRLRELSIHGSPQVTLAGTQVFPASVRVDHSV